MSPTRLTTGDRAPLLTLPDTDGRLVRLAPEEAAATVVVFTANGCPYARAWHDRVQDVARDYAGRDVRVLQIVSNDDSDHPQDSVDAMRERVAAGELAGPFLRDAEQQAARAYGTTATPEVFLLDRDGIVRYTGALDSAHGDPSQRAAWLREALDDVLAGRQVVRPRTSASGCSIKWRVEVLWWQGCPSRGEAVELLTTTLGELGRDDVHVVPREVRSRNEAQELGFPGSPTFSVGRQDLFPTSAPPALTCRVYSTADGRPSPLPDRTDLAGRLQEALARPWDLPGWVDPRPSPAPAAAASG